jgi:hypothetical protein
MAVFEELPGPAGELVGIELELVAEIGDGNLAEECRLRMAIFSVPEK